MVLDDASLDGSQSLGGINSVATPPNPALIHSLPLHLRPELLVKPDPFTLYGAFWGKTLWHFRIARSLTFQVEESWVESGRLPTQDEFDAFTAAESRETYTSRLAYPITYFLGSSYLYLGARRSPYYPKKPTPAKLLSGLYQYRLADQAGFRSMIVQKCFSTLFIFATSAIITGFAAQVRYQSDMQDPRLSGYNTAKEHATPEEVQSRKRALANDRRRRMKTRDLGLTLPFLQDLGYSLPGQGEQDRSKDDSASSAAVSSESETADGTSQNDHDVYVPQPSYGSGQDPGNWSSQSNSKQDFFGSIDDDDASPTAPEHRNTSMTGASTGSVWDRIRQQNSAQGSRPAPPRQWGQAQAQSETMPTNDTLPIDQDRYDYDRRREKDQAQADFDKMMDAERNASSEGPSRSRNW